MGNVAKTMSPVPAFNGVRTAISNDWGVTWTSEITRNITRESDIDPHVVYLSDGRFRMYLRSAKSGGIIAIDGTSPTSFDTSRVTVVLADRANGITMRFDPFVVKYPNGNVVCYTGTDAGAGAMTQTVVAASSIARPTSVRSVAQASTVPLQMSVAPNPAQNLVTVHFTLTKSERITLKLFNALGQEIAQILDAELGMGEYLRSINISHLALANGTYLLCLQTPTFSQTQSLQVIR